MEEEQILQSRYFSRPTVVVARSLLGKYLVRENGLGTIAGKIIEVEAYCGPKDLACHASKGRTARTEVLYGPPGTAYVYLIYGMYHCLKAVRERAEFPAAVLMRAWEGDGWLMDGRGRLGGAWETDVCLNRHDMTSRERLWFEDRGMSVKRSEVRAFPRIGVDYAGL